MNNKKKILISPLNWGLGHATRCVPIIEQLISDGNDIIIGGNGDSYNYLTKRFPILKSYHIPGVEIKYGKRSAFPLVFLVKLPFYLLSFIKEKRALRNINKTESFDIIISDNRPGLYCENVYSIYITHQVNIKMPHRLRLLNRLASRIHQKLIKRFSECWVPDICNEKNLTGTLYGKIEGVKTSRIGALSRFKDKNSRIRTFEFNFAFIISGPQPQKKIFKNLIINKLEKSNYKSVIFESSSQLNENILINNNNILTYINADDDLFYDICVKSKSIVCRSGYSTIMDLVALKRQAVLIPTPGQSEQEYLAECLSDNFNFSSFNQNDFAKLSLENILETGQWDIDRQACILKKVLTDVYDKIK